MENKNKTFDNHAIKMNTENKNTKITAEDIEKYFQGKLTPQQMNTLEKQPWMIRF